MGVAVLMKQEAFDGVVKTRAPSSVAMAEESDNNIERSSKRSKFNESDELEVSSSSCDNHRNSRLIITPEISSEDSGGGGGGVLVVCSSSRCCSNSSKQLIITETCESGILRSDFDLQSELGFKFENSRSFSIIRSRGRRESNFPFNGDFILKANELDSTGSRSSKAAAAAASEKANSSRRTTSRTADERMPSDAEIEGFFSAEEKQEQKRFAEKYNYDIVKDIPLEGRYDWVHVKP